ncbi:MAG: NAD(P)-dependent oxidoreductase [Sphingobium sp.]|nr:MAG: NAD(P)-dependent oxidoreductase [Sphingobium sp.]
MADSIQKIAILGLGVMGNGMAGQLLSHGFALSIWNRTPAKAQLFAESGARIAASPADAAEGADLVIAMVADDDASRSVWLGEEGALSTLPSGAIGIESSTLSVGWVRELAAVANERGVAFLDAPVSGSKNEAESGNLRFLVGGEAETVARAAPVLDALGRETVPCGPAGSGALIKLINNFLCGTQIAAFAEALVMAERGGMDPALAGSILMDGAPGSPIVKTVGQRMIDDAFAPNFFASLMTKDLRYAISTAQDSGLPLQTAHGPLALFEKALAQGHGQEDMAAVFKAVV